MANDGRANCIVSELSQRHIHSVPASLQMQERSCRTCETFTSHRQEVEFILEKPQSIIAKSLARVVGDSLKQAGISADNLDAVAIALGPGLGPCLRVGATVARSLASYLRIPLVPVNHAIGHIEIGILTTEASDPLVVLVSGGHTAITAFSGGRWRIFGETEDITIGNLYDMFAREIKLPSPAGPQIEGLARKASKFIHTSLRG